MGTPATPAGRGPQTGGARQRCCLVCPCARRQASSCPCTGHGAGPRCRRVRGQGGTASAAAVRLPRWLPAWLASHETWHPVPSSPSLSPHPGGVLEPISQLLEGPSHRAAVVRLPARRKRGGCGADATAAAARAQRPRGRGRGQSAEMHRRSRACSARTRSLQAPALPPPRPRQAVGRQRERGGPTTRAWSHRDGLRMRPRQEQEQQHSHEGRHGAVGRACGGPLRRVRPVAKSGAFESVQSEV